MGTGGGVTVKATQIRHDPDHQLLLESCATGRVVEGRWHGASPAGAAAIVGGAGGRGHAYESRRPPCMAASVTPPIHAMIPCFTKHNYTWLLHLAGADEAAPGEVGAPDLGALWAGGPEAVLRIEVPTGYSLYTYPDR